MLGAWQKYKRCYLPLMVLPLLSSVGSSICLAEAATVQPATVDESGETVPKKPKLIILTSDDVPVPPSSGRVAVNATSLDALQHSAQSLEAAAQSLQAAVQTLKSNQAPVDGPGVVKPLPWGAEVTPQVVSPQPIRADVVLQPPHVEPAKPPVYSNLPEAPKTVAAVPAASLPWLAKVAPAAQSNGGAVATTVPVLTPPLSAGAPLPWATSVKKVEPMPAPAQAVATKEVEAPAASPLVLAQPASDKSVVPPTQPKPIAAQKEGEKVAGESKKADAPLLLAEKEDMKTLPDPFAAGKTPAEKYSVLGRFLKEIKGVVVLNVGKYARPASVMDSIRLDEAVAFALKNNLELQASHSSTKSAALEKMTAYSRYLPSVDVKLSKGREESLPASYNDQFGNRVLDDRHQRADRTFAVRQPLIDLEVVADIINSADKEALANHQASADKDNVAYDTISAYLKLVQAKIAFQLAEQYRNQLDELSKHMSTRVEVGGATAGDLERIKVHSSVAEAARAEALGEYESSLAEFRRLTQITPAQLDAFSVTDPKVPVSLDDALKSAMQHNPDYIVSRNKIDIASSTRNSVLAKTIPKVSLEYSDSNSWDAGGAAKGNPVDGAYPNQRDKRLLLVAHWALNGGTEIGEGLTAAEKMREARFRSLDVKARLEEGMVASYNAIAAADQRLEIIRRAIESSEKVVSEFTDQYKNGSRSIFELLDAHGQLYNNRLGMMRMEITRILAAYQVHRQMGDIVPTLIAQAPSRPVKKKE